MKSVFGAGIILAIGLQCSDCREGVFGVSAINFGEAGPAAVLNGKALSRFVDTHRDIKTRPRLGAVSIQNSVEDARPTSRTWLSYIKNGALDEIISEPQAHLSDDHDSEHLKDVAATKSPASNGTMSKLRNILKLKPIQPVETPIEDADVFLIQTYATCCTH